VAVSEGVPRFWLLPLFGHSMAAPPEAAASFTTTKGENVPWPDRLSSSTTSDAPPAPELLLEDELELLDEDELLDEELELLEELELDELLLDDEEEELLLPERLISTTLACASRKAL
jgi:hypothetical protein